MKIKIILLEKLLQEEIKMNQIFEAVVNAVLKERPFDEACKIVELNLSFPVNAEIEKQLCQEVEADLEMLKIIDKRLGSWWKRALFGRQDLEESKQAILEKEWELSKVIQLAFYVYMEAKYGMNSKDFALDFARYLSRLREKQT